MLRWWPRLAAFDEFQSGVECNLEEPFQLRRACEMTQVVFADESGNGDRAMPLVVACIRVQHEALESLSENLVDLRTELLADPSFSGHASMDSLLEHGFHRTGDLPDTQVRFLETLQGNVGFRAFVSFLKPEDRAESSPNHDLERLYGAVLPSVLQTNFRSTTEVIIESGDRSAEGALRSVVRNWSAVDRYGEEPNVTVKAKAEEPLLALADYFAGVIGASLRKDASTFDASVMEYRHLQRLLPDLAYLVDVGGGKAWSRATIDQFPGSW